MFFFFLSFRWACIETCELQSEKGWFMCTSACDLRFTIYLIELFYPSDVHRLMLLSYYPARSWSSFQPLTQLLQRHTNSRSERTRYTCHANSIVFNMSLGITYYFDRRNKYSFSVFCRSYNMTKEASRVARWWMQKLGKLQGENILQLLREKAK